MARFFSFVVLVILVGAIGIFAYYNFEAVDVRFLQWGMTTPLAAVAGAAYLLGMLSGWSVVGVFRRSLNRVTETPNNARYS
jgi:lipopolysaccharide assembly protein A